MSNATHRKKIARAYAAQAGLSYSAALGQVVAAAEQGRLPSRLDDAGIAAAVRVLADADGHESIQLSVDPRPAELARECAENEHDCSGSVVYGTHTDEDEIVMCACACHRDSGTVPGLGCAHPNQEYAGDVGMVCQACQAVLSTHEQMVAADAFYLQPSSLRRLREVWQGRVTFTRRSPVRVTFTIDEKVASDIKDIELRWLAKHGYISVRLSPDEEWTVAQTTDLGDAVLAVNGADANRFADGLRDAIREGVRAVSIHDHRPDDLSGSISGPAMQQALAESSGPAMESRGARPGLLRPLSEDEANAVFDVLVRTVGAVEIQRGLFVEQQAGPMVVSSRFFGALIEGDAIFRRSIGPRADESEGEQWLVRAFPADRFPGRAEYFKAALVALEELRVEQGHNYLVGS